MSMQAAMRVAAVAVGIIAAGLVSSVGVAVADEPVVYDFPAGVACTFPLHVETGAASEPRKLPGRNGESRLLRAGKGQTLTFTNFDTSESVSLKANGSVQRATIHSDGTSTWEVTGHNVIILFPSDVPAGPSTKLYVGRVLYTSTATSDFTVQQVSGSSLDLCAELS